MDRRRRCFTFALDLQIISKQFRLQNFRFFTCLVPTTVLLTSITTTSLLQLRWSTVCFLLITREISSWRNTGRALSAEVYVITSSRPRRRQWIRRMYPRSCRPHTTISSPYTGASSSSSLSSRLRCHHCLSLSSCTEWRTQFRSDYFFLNL